MVSLERVLPSDEQAAGSDKLSWHKGQTDEAILKRLVEDHHKWTGSLQARHLLDQWEVSRAKFVKVFPNEYKRALGERAAKAAAPQAIAVDAPPAAAATGKSKATSSKTKAPAAK
jgi:glutamate synthase (NADPH/NADH) large chain